MHTSAVGCSKEEIIDQVRKKEPSVHDYASYVPVKNVVEKLKKWKDQGAEILYLSSHETVDDVEKDKQVLRRYNFPDGQVFFRQKGQAYKDIVEEIIPDVLIDDDCESIGGEDEMTITFVKPEVKKRVKSIVVEEFGGIDHLPDKISALLGY